MAKQLVIVVHGVGVKEAGVSADLLATALDDTPEMNSNLKRADLDASRLRPHSSDDFHLREMAQYNDAGKRQVFPARIRRYRQNDEATGKLLQERVVADFYWGDVSNIASGVAGLLLGILKTILGLCHIVRENASSVFPGNGWNSWIRKIANSAALTIHGPIAAINVVLILGVLFNGILEAYILKPDDYSKAAHPWLAPVVSWLTITLTLIGGFWNLRKSQVYLTRWLALWVLVTGLILACLTIGLPSLTASDSSSTTFMSSIDEKLRHQVCSAKDLTRNHNCEEVYGGIFGQGLRLLGLMGIAWVWVIAANAIVVFAELLRLGRIKNGRTPSLVSATIALLSMLWIILIAAIWASIYALPFNTLPEMIQLQPILGTVSYALGAILAVTAAGGAIFLGNQIWARNFKLGNYIVSGKPEVAQAIAERHRVIIAPAMLYFIWLFLAIFTFTTIVATLYLTGNLALRAGWLTPVEDLMHDHFKAVLTVIAFAGSVVIGFGQQQLRAGLGIAIDVITWLNDHSWNSFERGTSETRVFAERWFPKLLNAGSGTKTQGYWRKERIKNRLKVMMEKLISDEQPTEIIFVSHSQGTVVAIDVLNEQGRNWLNILPETATLKLATMGSPYTHVHRHYFPHAFSAIDQMPDLAKRKYAALTENDGILSDWINIFRIDDFVGTYIDPTGQWPREVPVAANGHTYYWIDENVFPILKDFVK